MCSLIGAAHSRRARGTGLHSEATLTLGGQIDYLYAELVFKAVGGRRCSRAVYWQWRRAERRGSWSPRHLPVATRDALTRHDARSLVWLGAGPICTFLHLKLYIYMYGLLSH